MRRRVKCAPNLKVPADPGSWTTSDDEEEVNLWISQGFNLGVICSGITIVDWDDKERARAFFKTYQGIIRVGWTTRRGAHFVFAGETATRRCEGYDLKSGSKSFCIVPPSRVRGFQYELFRGSVDASDLTELPKELIPPRKETQHRDSEPDYIRRITRAKLYAATVRCIPDGTAGRTLFRLVCWMRDLGLSQGEVFAVLSEWNKTNCFQVDGVTPFLWTNKQLNHKISDSFALGSKAVPTQSAE